MNPLATLKFMNIDTQLPNSFPNDQNADIILVLNGKETFQLQSHLLKKRSKYFETQLLNTEAKFKVIPGKYDSQVFQKILKCFYGDVYNIYKDEDFFLAFHISHFLQINNFIAILQDSMFENFNKINFLIIYSLAEQFEIDLLREKCMDYLDEQPEKWRIILPIQKLESYRQIYFENHQNKPTAEVPINILHLKEEILIKLLRFHNERKDKISFPEKFLSPDDLFSIINWYVKIRFQSQVERQNNAQRLVNQLFIFEDICSDNNAKKLFNFMSKSQRSSSNISQITNTSINEKQHKIIFEQTIEIDELKKNLQYLREENCELKQKILLYEDRIEILQKLMENQKASSKIQEKSLIKQEIETSQFVNRPLERSFISNGQEIFDTSFFQHQLQFNNTPQTVFSIKEISYLSDILNAKIYQQIKFKLLYRGSESNFHSISEEQLIEIKKATSILILIRSVENDKVFGIFYEYNKIQVINFQNRKRVDYKKELKLTINSQYLLKLGNDIEIFVDCCNKKNNICNNINGLGCLAGKNEFQVDELEIYECSIHNEIV